MDCLFDRFKTLDESYYHIKIQPETLFSNSSSDPCCTFIKKHFASGAKGSALTTMPFYQKYKTKGKHAHTVALYLLGLSLQTIFNAEINRALSEFLDTTGWYAEDPDRLKYTWFLTCLYHDIASSIETDATYNPSWESLVEQYPGLSGENDGIPSRFNPRTIKAYFEYQKRRGETDHGIVAGSYLYSELKANFDLYTKGHDWENEPICRKKKKEVLPVTGFHDDEYFIWCKDQLRHHAYVANAIICHNMWTTSSKDEKAEEYRLKGLDELIITEDDDRLSVNKMPLHFMLCLLDTIEPVKRISLSPQEILQNISIEPVKSNMTNSLKIEWTDTIKQADGFWRWLPGIYGMKTWMQVDVSPCERTGDHCSVMVSML